MDIIIVGAGPTGLTAGIELARRGAHVQIIDKKKTGSTLSRAVGINPHSLNILEASGVTKQLLKAGIEYHTAYFYQQAKPWVQLQLDAAKPVQYGYNFMLGLPQDKTEKILKKALEDLGGVVHYSTAFETYTDSDDKVEVTTTEGQVFTGDYLIGADGVHSVTRELMGIAFDGLHLPEPWSIADVDTDASAPIAGVSMYLLGGGEIVFIAPIGKNRFRLVSNTARVLDNLPFECKIKKVRTESQFHIKVAQVKSYQKGRVFLAGDAAHAHSPAGGRGMNLGMADAAELARRIVNGQTAGYTASRYAEGKKIIAGSELLRKGLTAKNPLRQYLALGLLKCAGNIPYLQQKMASRFLYG